MARLLILVKIGHSHLKLWSWLWKPNSWNTVAPSKMIHIHPHDKERNVLPQEHWRNIRTKTNFQWHFNDQFKWISIISYLISLVQLLAMHIECYTGPSYAPIFLCLDWELAQLRGPHQKFSKRSGFLFFRPRDGLSKESQVPGFSLLKTWNKAQLLGSINFKRGHGNLSLHLHSTSKVSGTSCSFWLQEPRTWHHVERGNALAHADALPLQNLFFNRWTSIWNDWNQNGLQGKNV